jgi:hypothetical protein
MSQLRTFLGFCRYPKDDTLFGRAEEEHGEEKYVATDLLKDKCEHLSGEGVG